jgi:hypothetical protein
MSGCGREARLPTAVAPLDEFKAAPNLGAGDQREPVMMRGRGHRHLPSRTLIAEAKEALGAVLTGEQVYYQKWGTFTDVPDTADFGAVLGVYFGDLIRRWDFSVGDASGSAFVAKAQGRDGTDAKGITVTLTYEVGEPLLWNVERRRPCR